MPFNLKVQVSGDTETMKKLQAMKSTLLDWSPEMRLAGDYLTDFFQNAVFETEGGVFGMRWSPLKPSYDHAKRTKFPGRGILEATGKMRRSWDKNITPMSVQVYNNTPYAGFHQTGTRYMKARPLIHVDDKLRDKLTTVFKEGLARKLGVVFK